MRFLRAAVPSGPIDGDSAVWLVEHGDPEADLLDVLGGNPARRTGTGSVEACGFRGRYRAIRDFRSGSVVVETLSGRKAPDPGLVPPALLLGAPWPPTGAAPRAPAAGPGLIAIMAASGARRLEAAAAAIEAAERPPASSRPAPPAAQRALERALDALAAASESELARAEKRRETLAACGRDLKRAADGAESGVATRELRELAAAWERATAAAGRIGRWRAPGGPRTLLTALTLAWAGVGLLGAALAQLSLLAGGFAGAGMLLAFLAIKWWATRRTDGRIRSETGRIRDDAGRLLYRARWILNRDLSGPGDLLEIAAALDRRDLLTSIRTRIDALLAADTPAPRPDEGGAPRGATPIAALRSAVAAKEGDLLEKARRQTEEAFRRGERSGAAAALRHEAVRRRAEGDRHRRWRNADALWRRIAARGAAPEAESLDEWLARRRRGGSSWPATLPARFVPESPGALAIAVRSIVAAGVPGPVIVPVSRALAESASRLEVPAVAGPASRTGLRRAAGIAVPSAASSAD